MQIIWCVIRHPVAMWFSRNTMFEHMPARDESFDAIIGELVAYLKRTGQQAHTKNKGGSLIIVPRREKRSRLTGAKR